MKTQVKKTKTKKFVAPVDSDGCLVLQGELFWKWKSADSEMRTNQLALKVAQGELDGLLDKYPDVKAIIAIKMGLIQQAPSLQQEYARVIVEMEKALGISMKTASIDDKTGRVFILDASGTPAPQKAKKARSTIRK